MRKVRVEEDREAYVPLRHGQVLGIALLLFERFRLRRLLIFVLRGMQIASPSRAIFFMQCMTGLISSLCPVPAVPGSCIRNSIQEVKSRCEQFVEFYVDAGNPKELTYRCL